MKNNFPLAWGRIACFWILLWSMVVPLHAQDSERDSVDSWQRLRLLFVPEAELASVLAGETQRVILDREEVEQLLRQATEIERKKRGVAVTDFRLRGPEQFVWEQAEYRLELSGEWSHLVGYSMGRAYGREPLSLFLPWKGGLLHKVQMNQQTPVWYQPQDQQPQLLITQHGEVRFDIEMSAPVTSDSVRQTVHIQLPAAAVASLQVQVPGNVDLLSGAAVLERKYQETTDLTEFRLAAGGDSLELVFTLNNRQKSETLVWDTRCLMVAEVSRQFDRFQWVVENQVLQGQLSDAVWSIPADLEIAQVVGDGVRQWRVVTQDDQTRLQIWFHSAQAALPFHVFAFRQRSGNPAEFDWELPSFIATTAFRQPRLVQVHTTEDLLIPRMQLEKMDLVPAPIATPLLQPHAIHTDAELVRVGSWYGAAADAQLRLSFRPAEDRYSVMSSHFALLSEENIETRSVFRIDNEGDLRFEVRLELAPGFRIRSVTDDQGELPFRSLAAESGSTIQIDLRQGIGGSVQSFVDRDEMATTDTSNSALQQMLQVGGQQVGGQRGGGQQVVGQRGGGQQVPGAVVDTAPTTPRSVELVVIAEWVPEDWFAVWESRTLQLQPATVLDAEQTAGIIAVRVASEFGLTGVDAGDMVALGRQQLREADLELLNPDLAFDFNDTAGLVSLELKRQVAEQFVQSVSYYTLEATRLLFRGEVLIDVRQVAMQNFEFRLPSQAPESLSLGCQEPWSIRHQQKSADDPTVWQVQLNRPAIGLVRFYVDYELPISSPDNWRQSLEPMTVVAAPLQANLIALEGSARIDTNVETQQPKWSADQLPETIYQPGRRLIGVWDVTDSKLGPVTASMSAQQTVPTPSALVQNRELDSRISSAGAVITSGKFLVKTTTGILLLQLPRDAKLWSLSQDGIPQTVQYVEDRILLSFADHTGGKAQEVSLVYEHAVDSGIGQVRLEAPTWWFPTTSNAAPVEVPTLKTQWSLQPPPGTKLRSEPSQWNVDHARPRTSWAQRQSQWFNQHVFGWLKSVLPSTALASRYDNAPKSAADQWAQSEVLADVMMEQSEAAAGSQQTVAAFQPSQGGMAGRGGRSGLPGSADFSVADLDMARSGETRNEVTAPPSQPPLPPQKSLLGVQGFRSLTITAEDSTAAMRFYGLGNKSELSIELVDSAWVDQLTWVAALFCFAVGLLCWRWSWRAWLCWAAWLLVLAAISQWFYEQFPEVAMILERLIWVVVALIAWRWVMTLATGIRYVFGVAGVRRTAPWHPRFGSGTVALLLLILNTNDASLAFQVHEVNADTRVLRIPDESILIPFDPTQPEQRLSGSWFVPKPWYDRWRSTIANDQTRPPVFPERLILPGGVYRILTNDSQAVDVTAEFDIYSPTKQSTRVPIRIRNGALMAASLDERPISLTGNASSLVQAMTQTNDANQDVHWLDIPDQGIQRLKLSIRYPLSRIPGGWEVQGALPFSLAAQIEVQPLPSQSRLTWTSGGLSRHLVIDQQGTATGLGLGADGEFSMRWRTAEGQARVSTAAIEHAAEVFVRETGTRVVSNFRVRSIEPSDEWMVSIPTDARIESLQGNNLRSWSFVTGQTDQVLVQFLTSSHEQQLTVTLAGQSFVWGSKSQTFEVPFAQVRGDGNVSGQVRLYHSSLLDIEVVQAQGLRRGNFSEPTPGSAPWLMWQTEVVPLQAYQAFEREAGQPKLQIAVVKPRPNFQVLHRGLLHCDVGQTDFETQITVAPNRSFIDRLILKLPHSLEPLSLTCVAVQSSSGNALLTKANVQRVDFQVAKRNLDTDQDEYELRFGELQTQELQVTLRGRLPSSLLKAIQWQPIQVADAAEQRYEYAVTRADTLEVELVSSEGSERVLPDQFRDWLSAQRRASLPLTFRSPNPQHVLNLSGRRVPSQVTFDSITDLTIGDRIVEETILLEWEIQQSGINQVEFLLPQSWRDCQIEGPWISRIQRDVQDSGVHFTVILQDRILGEYRLVATLDLPIQATNRQASVPQNLTGETRNRWITTQNTGQTELEFLPLSEVQEIQRQRPIFSRLQNKLRATYLANAFEVDGKSTAPVLQWKSVPRTTIETRSARVRMSETDLTLDRSGFYVAKTKLQINNQTQPTLQLQLPVDAQLMTLVVDGLPTQPIVNAATGQNRVVIPLLKSSGLNLDYPIEVVYHGQVELSGSLQELSLPLCNTVDVESEVSHVRLHLPAELRPLRFGGTMSQVNSAGELLTEVLDYQVRQLADFKKMVLEQKLSGVNHLRRKAEFDDYLIRNKLSVDGLGRDSTVQSAISQLERALSESAEDTPYGNWNRSQLKDLVLNQDNSNEANLDKKYDANFEIPELLEQSKVNLDQIQQRMSNQAAKPGSELSNLANRRLADAIQADEEFHSKASLGRGSIPEVPQSAATSSLARASGQQGQPGHEGQLGQAQGGGFGFGGSQRFSRQQAGQLVPNGHIGQVTPPVIQGERARARVTTGLLVDFDPQGATYYFRVPRGKPELTVTWTGEDHYQHFWSTVQLVLAALVIGLILRWTRPQR